MKSLQQESSSPLTVFGTLTQKIAANTSFFVVPADLMLDPKQVKLNESELEAILQSYQGQGGIPVNPELKCQMKAYRQSIRGAPDSHPLEGKPGIQEEMDCMDRQILTASLAFFSCLVLYGACQLGMHLHAPSSPFSIQAAKGVKILAALGCAVSLGYGGMTIVHSVKIGYPGQDSLKEGMKGCTTFVIGPILLLEGGCRNLWKAWNHQEKNAFSILFPDRTTVISHRKQDQDKDRTYCAEQVKLFWTAIYDYQQQKDASTFLTFDQHLQQAKYASLDLAALPQEAMDLKKMLSETFTVKHAIQVAVNLKNSFLIQEGQLSQVMQEKASLEEQNHALLLQKNSQRIRN